MQEIWKDIKEFEGLYQVSSFGRIKRIRFINNYVNKPQEKILSCTKIDNLGYPTTCLCKQGKRKYKRIHRLVAESFIKNPNNFPCVNHIDGNKLNNNVENLEWCTHSYNTRHALSIGLISAEKLRRVSRENIKKAQKFSPCLKGGENSPSSVLKEKDVLEIRLLRESKKMPIYQLSKKYNVHRSTIQRILSRKTWTYLK